MKTEVIIPAGGSGVRFGGTVPKIFVELRSQPLILHSLTVFESSPSVTSVIIAGEASLLPTLKSLVDQHGLKKVKAIVAGGETRRASIENGLKVLDADTSMVMVHDAARPLICVEWIEAAIADARQSGANVIAVPAVSTIKRVDPRTRVVRETLDRSELWEIQTPQTFRRDILLDAYARRGDFEPTDDASLVERLGYPVKIIEGSRKNIKITTPEDVMLAESLLRKIIE